MKKRTLGIGILFFVAMAAFTSCHKINITQITQKLWFLRTYERWDTDNNNKVIPDSYRDWTYYGNEGYENWFFYFKEDNSGYQYHTYQGDTIVYFFEYYYYPKGDSLNIIFQTENDSVENYHATINELTESVFSFTNPYRPHQYERLNMVNATGNTRAKPNLNPKKIAKKPAGALIQAK